MAPKLQLPSLSSHSSGALFGVLVAAHVGVLLTWVHSALRPPPPRVCGSLNGPPVTAPRAALRDGRHLAYKEIGVPKENAKYKAVFVHGFHGSRHSVLPFSQDFLEEHGIVIVSFDRAGYGQSDPNPSRDIKSEVHDVEQLADHLEFRQKFFLITQSIGGYTAWGCLKYIPHRLAGVGMICPVTNFWWPGISRAEFKEAFNKQGAPDRWFLWVTHHLPWLAYWWMTQQWFPTSTAMQRPAGVFGAFDEEVLRKQDGSRRSEEAIQQGVFESLCRDAVVMFGNWEFDPGNLEDPFPDRPGSVHLWQGDDDYLVPVLLQRYIHRRLPWIEYHELKGKGHFLKCIEGFPDNVLRTLLLGEKIEYNS